MKTKFVQTTFAILLALGALACFVLPTSAHSSSTSSMKFACSGLQYLHVHMRGSQVMTSQCENGRFENIIKAHTPLVSQDNNCNGSSLWLFDDNNVPSSPGEICFTSSTGTGLVNLTSFSHVSFGPTGAYIDTWNAGCSSGSFYSDTNQGGSHIRYGVYSQGTISYTFGMSSLTMDQRCS